jgi:uncharacterized delta-60 repeat protein
VDTRGRRRWQTWLAVALAAAGIVVGAALAGPGDLDTGFGTGGRISIDLGGHDAASSLFLLPDGRMLLAGSGESNNEVVALRRLADGSPDVSFGTGGRIFADFGGLDVANDAALTPDGKLVIVGTSTQGAFTYIVVLRRNADGSPDNSFNGNGRLLLSLGDTNAGLGVAVQPDGKIVLTGRVFRNGSGTSAVVTRLLVNGTPDPSFDMDGTAFIGLKVSEGRDVLVQPDGRIVVVGTVQVDDDTAAARLTTTGGLDPTFNGTGTIGLPGPGFGIAQTVVRQPDGKLLLIGSTNGSLTVTRLTAGGLLDGNYGISGTLKVTLYTNESGNAGALQPDGKLVVAGTTSGGSSDQVVLRIQPGGVLDSTFGIDGIRTIDFGGQDRGLGLALRADGTILVAGGGGPGADVTLARLQGDPQPAGAGPGAGGGGAPGRGGAPGTAIPRCAGLRATIVGTARKDLLRGTPRKDVIAGLAGDDVIRGLGGDDVICGGPGADRLLGGAGRDHLLGEAGRDALDGGAGRDILAGGTGRDRCAGGAERDHAACERSRTL